MSTRRWRRDQERPPPATHPQVQTRGNVQERLSQLLDASLFDSTIAGEVRALSQKAEELEQMFEGLAALGSFMLPAPRANLLTKRK